jgi:hypothetical protein
MMAKLSALIEHNRHNILLFCQSRILICLIAKKEKNIFTIAKFIALKKNYIF